MGKKANTMFGCEIEYPVIKSLVGILNEKGNNNSIKYKKNHI